LGKKNQGGGRSLGKEIIAYAQNRMKLSRFNMLVGFEVEQLWEGGSVLSMTVQDHHRQIHGVVHGGVTAALADTAAAFAAYTVVPKGTELVTIELKINYLLPIPEGKVRAEGKVLRAGRNFVVVECDVRNHRRETAAKALMTFGASPGHTLKKRVRAGRPATRAEKR
jgi:uncharacterized protein (TIGR00369 family)